MCLNYNQYKRSLRENGDVLLYRMMFGQQCPTVAYIMASPLDKYITLADNDRGYSGTVKDQIVNYVHWLFLKAKPTAS